MKINCPISQHPGQRTNEPAIIERGQSGTYLQLDRMISRAMVLLVQKGITKRSRVALIGRNSSEYIVLLFALWRLGAIAVPLNFRFPLENIRNILKRQEIHYLIAGTPDAPDAPDDLDFKEPGIITINWEEFKHSIHQDLPLNNRIKINLNNPAAVILTSGSTGKEKGVLHTYGNYYYNALGSNENIKLAPGDRWLLSLPLFHVGGLGILFRCFTAGAAVVVPAGNESIEESLMTYGVTHASLVSTQLLRLINHMEEGKAGAFSHLKVLLLGGSGFPTALIHKALSLKLPIYTSYGLSEMASQVTTTPAGAPADKLFTSGKLLPYRQLMIDKNNEICVKGKTLFKGYIEGTALTKPWVKEKGKWFHTGDLGRWDKDGYLVVIGRRDNMFISGGENIMPEEIEAILKELPGIEEAVVIPVINETYGFRPAAFLKLKRNVELNKEYIVSYLMEKLPRFKIPDYFYHWPKELEQTSLKIKRSLFMELLQKQFSQGQPDEINIAVSASA
ncbi:MAG: o-succinylbenzoate--CoA ligase [Acidobacteria bacterium]|jgi:O-succinylbenzoic acid--CoA ligase|nr:o-succinylbenzoate--CoA ligase [Acidobacteriota bacterium]